MMIETPSQRIIVRIIRSGIANLIKWFIKNAHLNFAPFPQCFFKIRVCPQFLPTSAENAAVLIESYANHVEKRRKKSLAYVTYTSGYICRYSVNLHKAIERSPCLRRFYVRQMANSRHKRKLFKNITGGNFKVNKMHLEKLSAI